jgi:hypothetical protein
MKKPASVTTMFRNDAITADNIVGSLRRSHSKDIWFEELRLSSGFAWQGRIDFLAISPSPAAGNKAVAYEIKVSKSDFNRDTYDKQRGARLYSDQFYYVAPVGLLKTSDIPDWAGLYEAAWYAPKYSDPHIRLKEVITAPKRDKEPPSWGLVCSLVRNAKRHGGSL